MPSARNSQALLERAIRAWVACGQPGRGLEVTMEGTVRVLGGEPEAVASSPANGRAGEDEAAWDAKVGAGR